VLSLDLRLQPGHACFPNGAPQYRRQVNLNECAQYGQIMLSNVPHQPRAPLLRASVWMRWLVVSFDYRPQFACVQTLKRQKPSFKILGGQ
jgi:hypothetical protein